MSIFEESKKLYVDSKGSIKHINTNENVGTESVSGDALDSGDDTAKLRAMRMMQIQTELTKVETSYKESFYNRISGLKYDLLKDKEKIKGMEIFINYYFINNFLTTYVELSEGDLELSEPFVYSMVVLFDKLFFTHKWDVRRIADYFIKQTMDQVNLNKEFAVQFNSELDEFYDKVIIKNSKQVN